jgi:hypothetical protein
MKPIINPNHSLSTTELLSAIPVRNRAAQVEKDSPNELVLSVPLDQKWYMKPPVRWLFPFSTHRRMGLDILGAEVWRCCDGINTAEDIITRFAASHHLSFHEARLSVMLFLKELVRRGALVMVGAAQEGAREAA